MSESQTATDDSFQDAEEQAYQEQIASADDDAGVLSVNSDKQESPADNLQSSPSKSKKKKNKKKANSSVDSTATTGVPAAGKEDDKTSEAQQDLSEQPTHVLESKSVEQEQEEDQLPGGFPGKEDDETSHELPAETSQKSAVKQELTPEEDQDQSLNDQTILSSTLEGPISESTQSMDIISDITEDSRHLDDQINELNHSLNDNPTEDEQELVREPVTETAKEDSIPDQVPISPHHKGDSSIEPQSTATEHVTPSKPTPPELPKRDISNAPVLPPLPARNVSVSNEEVSSSSTSSPAPPPLPARRNSISSKDTEPTSFLPPPLPPQLTAAQKQQHRPSVFQSWFQRPSVSQSKESISEKSIDYDENYDLLLSRFSENNEDLKNIDDISRDQINTSHMELRSTFAERVSAIAQNESTSNKSTSFIDADNTELHEIDWPFWTQVVNDYPSVVKSEPAKLSKQLSGGIPSQVRGIVWQLVANSNTKEFNDVYQDLLTKESKFEKNIVKDLSRTSFMADYNIDQEAVHRIIKAYSILDTEVGYTQGMAFITVPLLMNLNEVETFALLHKLMYGYNIRSLYLPNMPGLLLKLYQFDRLVEDNLPKLHTHFKRQGVQSSMFASQWFLTFFAYKFPLEFVLRIFDIVITEGFESLLKFAIALVQKNEAKLLTLRFDDLIDFLKDQLFNSYLSNPISEDEDEDEDVSTGLANMFKKRHVTPITVDSYDVDSLVEDAMNVKIPPITLKRYEEEYVEIHRVEKERREEVEEIKSRNNQLRKEVRKLEASYTLLNREHVQIANEMINGRVKIATLEDENGELKEHNESLKKRVRSLQNPAAGDDVPVPVNLEEDLKKTMQRNLEVMSKNQELEDQLLTMMVEIDRLRAENESLKESAAAKAIADSEHRPSKGWTPKIFGNK